jgi:hypothetical protein
MEEDEIGRACSTNVGEGGEYVLNIGKKGRR